MYLACNDISAVVEICGYWGGSDYCCHCCSFSHYVAFVPHMSPCVSFDSKVSLFLLQCLNVIQVIYVKFEEPASPLQMLPKPLYVCAGAFKFGLEDPELA